MEFGKFHYYLGSKGFRQQMTVIRTSKDGWKDIKKKLNGNKTAKIVTVGAHRSYRAAA